MEPARSNSLVLERLKRSDPTVRLGPLAVDQLVVEFRPVFHLPPHPGHRLPDLLSPRVFEL